MKGKDHTLGEWLWLFGWVEFILTIIATALGWWNIYAWLIGPPCIVIGWLFMRYDSNKQGGRNHVGNLKNKRKRN